MVLGFPIFKLFRVTIYSLFGNSMLHNVNSQQNMRNLLFLIISLSGRSLGRAIVLPAALVVAAALAKC